MFRTNEIAANSTIQSPASIDQAGLPVNAIGEVDDFVTAEPTPKSESRRGWRRRRIRRGKS